MPKKTPIAAHKASHASLVPLLGVLAVLLVVWVAIRVAGKPNLVWQEPSRLQSTNGLLETTLDAKISEVKVGTISAKQMVYNGSYLGKTWEIKGGDKVKVHLENNLAEITNLHFHGSHVSPKGNSDNVLLAIKPGETFDYEYNLPETHPPGLYWYHPHAHPDVENQVIGGMAGAIIVRGDVDELPGIKGLPEKMLVLTTADGATTTERFVNGQTDPTMYLRPGETTRMEVLNASADDVFNLAIPGYKLDIFSRDGNTLDQVQSVDSELLFPGQRIQFIFTPKMKYETIEVKSMAYDQGFAKYHERTFMNIKVQGFPMLPKELPTQLPTHEDLRNAKIDNVRTLTFSEGGTAQNTTYLFDGKVFNMNTVNQVITLGTTEEWHLINKSSEDHPFHIHINPFQVISVNGQPVDLHGYRDTYQVPKNSEVVIRTRYTDFDGKFVLHCHILFHEDNGMMQIVEIVPPGKSSAKDNGVPDREMKQGDMAPAAVLGMPGMIVPKQLRKEK